MLCPVCQADNKEEDTSCTLCGTKMRTAGEQNGQQKRNSSQSIRRSRRKDAPGQVSEETEARNLLALRAYRISLFALIPGLALVLGPTAFVLGCLARQKCLRDPDFTLWGPLRASIAFGAAATVFNLVGFTLMYLGLRSAGVL
jgi:hypothetical protein